jgi:hypothetical protein
MSNQYNNNSNYTNPYNPQQQQQQPSTQQQGYIGGGQGYSHPYNRGVHSYGQQAQPYASKIIPSNNPYVPSASPYSKPYGSNVPQSSVYSQQQTSTYAAVQSGVSPYSAAIGGNNPYISSARQLPSPSATSVYSMGIVNRNATMAVKSAGIMTNTSTNRNESSRYSSGRRSPARRSKSKQDRRSPHRTKAQVRNRNQSPLKVIKEKPYVVKLSPGTLNLSEKQYLDLKSSYPNLHISPDFTKLINHWVLHMNEEHSAAEYEKQIIIDKHVPYEIDNESELLLGSNKTTEERASLHNGIKHNAKVMLIDGVESLLRSEKLKEENENIEYNTQHISNKLRFLVGKKEHSGLIPIGGTWSPRDGSDPTNDSTLIQTAIRTTRDFIGLDLSACTRWIKFLEIWYYRSAEQIQGVTYPEMQERTVIFIPSVWDIIPSLEHFEQIWKNRMEYLNQIRQKQSSLQESINESNGEENEESNSKNSSNEMEKDLIETKPEHSVLYCVTRKHKLENKIKIMAISLDGLLDYNIDDRLEKTFEVSLFAESFHEFLQRKFGRVILETIRRAKLMQEQKNKRPRKEGIDHDEHEMSAKKVKTSEEKQHNENDAQNEIIMSENEDIQVCIF